MHIDSQKHYPAAFREYLKTLQGLVSQYPDARILELGGGRYPSFDLGEMPDNVSSYTVNDIDANELALVDPKYDTACFDVTGDVSQFAGQYDVIFSRTLIEHVKDGFKMHQNVAKLLKPGGVAFHLAPTLYSPPFVLNRLLPESLSYRIVGAFFPHRKTTKPKFPAYYSWCFGDRGKMKKMLRRAGFGDINIRTFYGHGYYRKIPLLRDASDFLTTLIARRDWSTFGSFAYLIVYR